MSTVISAELEITESDTAALDEIMTVMREAFDVEFGEAWTRAQCEGMLVNKTIRLSIARRGGALAGFALSRVILDDAELLLLAVRPHARRAGVGRALLARAIAVAEMMGARRLHLEVRENNAAVGLYRSAGFDEIGRRADYYRGANGNKFDALTFAFPLDRR